MSTLLAMTLIVLAAAASMGVGIAMATRRGRGTETRSTSVASSVMARLHDLEAERVRMAAMLSGMVEGVLVVDAQGRLQLVNDAARNMLNLDPNLI